MPVFDRLKKAWNAFRNNSNELDAYDYGQSASYGLISPSRPRHSIYTERSIVSSIYTRISVDVSGILIKHIKIDEDGRYLSDVPSSLNECLVWQPNIDQSPRPFRQDIAMTLFDKGVAAVVPVDTTRNPQTNELFDVYSLRVGEIVTWYPRHVRLSVYNENKGNREDITLEKRFVAIIENPLYSVMNEPNSTLQRLIRKLSLLDSVDEQSGSGRLDLIIQLPYVIKSEARRQQAEKRREDIEFQLKGSQYGIAYTDGTEKITQLNRPAENNLLKQVEYLTNMLYNQLGLTEEVMNGTANEEAMLNYFNRTIEPIVDAIIESMQRAFLGPQGSQGDERIRYFRDPFKLVPVNDIAEIADKFTRNEILSANEIRTFLGIKPSDDPKADKLVNSNMPQPELKTEPEIEIKGLALLKGSVKMEADFSGYATKAGLQCSDGRTIMPGAFKHQDKMKVPLVWQHGHTDPENVLGHTILENREDGVYAYGYFNKSTKAVHAHSLLDHGDITMLSIWANELVERSGKVLHGAIREVSLVLSGANPGALIENVTIRHADGDDVTLDDEVIIYTGLELEHANADDKDEEKKDEIKHQEDDEGSEETVQDVYDSMSDKQKQVLHYMLGQALEVTESSEEVKQDNLNDDSNDTDQEGNTMTRNVFEKGDAKPELPVLSHADIEGIVADATKLGSLKDAVEAYALAHGINDIDILFPDAKAISNVPEFIQRRTEWVNGVLSGARKSPFSRIKTLSADITVEEARAKGYIKGTLKKEEFFGVAKRVTIPTTVYKKQKLDRDDMVDITDFDVVAWLKAEMRLMLDEEIARAVLIGDGRDVASEDKINEQNIRPIAKDHELYTTVINVNIDDANSSISEFVDAIVTNRQFYKGTGLPTMYTTETVISKFLLLKDTIGRRIYKTLEEVATELRVSSIVPVEVMEEDPTTMAILVNMTDYVLGADKGGQVSMFDDFDIDYNQYKYLIETRCSGALTKLKSAMVVKKVAAALIAVTPNAPTFDGTTVTVVAQTGVVYQDASDDSVLTAGTHAVPNGETLVVNAVPAGTHYFPSSEGDTWTFTNPA